MALVTETNPAVIVNCAAMADPASCEADPVNSQLLNVDLPAQLAQAARITGARLIHLSSEQVFDGTADRPYSVSDTPRAINRYGRQKIESEHRVLSILPSAAVVRLPLLLGNSPSGRRSVHEKMLEVWSAGGTARLFVDEIRQPCSADNVAEGLLELASLPELSGLFHWAGLEPVSRHVLGIRIREHFQIPEHQAPIVSLERKNDTRAQALRPARLTLDLAPLDQILITRPQRLADALRNLRPPSK